MGAWGTGPFDSDGSLDYLGDVADTNARRENHDIVADTVNHAGVVAELTSALEAITRPAGDPKVEYRTSTVENAYAAAGLVAAVLAGHNATEPSGTRLGAAIAAHRGGPALAHDLDPLGLRNHCGYVALLRAEDAQQLRAPAAAALAAIRTESQWLDSWFDTTGILEQLDRLQAALA